MKRNGEQNIIFDDDVTMSRGTNVGKKLSDVIDEQTSEIEGIVSNIKWLYKYGGIGSGSGGNNGSSTSWTVQITRVDTGDIIRDGITVNFGGEGTYGLKIQIYNGGTSTFRITYSYVNSKGHPTKNEVIGSEQGFAIQIPFILDLNGNINITILNQDTQEVISYVIPYIVSSYRFTLQYVYADTLEPVTFENNTIFMSSVKTRGIKVLFTSNVSVELTYSSYTYIDWNGDEHTVDMDDENAIVGETNKFIYLDLIPDLPSQQPGEGIKEFLGDNSNARFKQFLLKIDLLLKGNTEYENIPDLYLKDNLIPSDMYLKVGVSGGTIYDKKQTEYPINEQFVIGAIPFYLTPYYGSYVSGRTYNLEVYDATPDGNDNWNETKVNLNITTLSEQTQQTIIIQEYTSGEHRIKFKISWGNSSYEVYYYFFVKEASSNFGWYESGKNIQYQAYYRNYIEVKNIQGIDAYTPIEMTLNSDKKSLQFTNNVDENLNGYDQFISVGLQYSEINDLSEPIMTINVSDESSGRIYIYQNKVLISGNTDIDNPSGNSAEIFFPLTENLSQVEKNNYHLITIYKRYELLKDETYYKTISVYLDGVLEGIFNQTVTEHKNYNSVTFYNGNYFCNLFEYALFRHTTGDDNAYYNNSLSVPFLTDNDMVCYYYTYKERLLGGNISENERNLYTYFKNLREDKDNFIHTNESTIENIASCSEIPIIVLNSVDNSGQIGTSSGYNRDNFKIWMSEQYAENAVLSEVPVTVQWKGENDTELKFITKQGESNAASFLVTPQGSTTLTYRCKNFELIAPSASSSDYDCIFSPNFSENDKDTFLPEASFTLKADVVDSSHTNNNAIGKFVNTITTPFERAKQSSGSSQYTKYIKNCLTGFPVLVFLHTSYKSDAAVPYVDVEQFYLLGIYNFNLGRKSYYNLGYKKVSNLVTIAGGLKEGFNIYEIPKTSNGLLDGIVVGEIQGNDNHFDFSQADNSILFAIGAQDLRYMFGDIVDGNSSEGFNAKQKISNFVKKVSLAGGFVFTEVGKLFSEDANNHYGYDDGYSAVDENNISLNQVPSYRYKAVRSQTGTETSYSFTPIPQQDWGNMGDLINLLIASEDPKNEPSLDYASLCEYYTTCMAFGLVDSVQKNLNIKSWNASPSSEYPLFYVSFYDMDTCLGVSNSGSRIDYFAFSDYWQSELEDNTLKSVNVYRDFSPANSSGNDHSGFFDVPSSYLFAIAKYAYFVKNGINVDTSDISDPLYYHPSNLWAKWRRNDGCLSNADSFMNNFYVNHLNGTPYSAFNLNYRYKYLVKTNDQITYDGTNSEKFYGRKISYTKNWLEGRLHILDAYFNINSIPDVMVENKVYAPYSSNNLVDKTNDDIYVLKDIFSTQASGNRYPSINTSVEITSRSYAPLIIRSDNNAYRYLFPKEEEPCILGFTTSGNQYLMFGGSPLWTKINTINPFITTDSTLTVNSKHFTEIVGNNDKSCDTWTLSTPSLKTVTLTGQNYGGNLNFVSTGETVQYPNLTDIDISGTNIKLKINNAYVKKIKATNMKTASEISVTNVTTLNDVTVYGDMSSLNIPSWKGDGIYFPTNYTSNPDQQFNCNTMTVLNDVSVYPNNKLYVYNNNSLTKLTVQGFSEVYVNNCPSLSEIVIGDTTVLTVLNVIMPVDSTHTTFKIGNTDNVVDISNQQVLNNIKFNYCKMNKIIMPNISNIILPEGAFLGCKNLAYFTGDNTYYIGGSNTFKDCKSFTLKKDESTNAISPIHVHPSTTTLEGTFYISDTTTRGSIDLNVASRFLINNCNQAGNVTTISYLFYNQNILYDIDDLLNDYLSQSCMLSLGCFKKASNAYRAFLGNKICGYNRYMFKGFGKNTNKISINNIIGEFSNRDPYTQNNNRWKTIGQTRYHILYATSDFLYEILNKISTLVVRDRDTDNSFLYFVDTSNSQRIYDMPMLSEVKIGEEVFKYVIGSETIYPGCLTTIRQFEVYPLHKINLNNMFYYDSVNSEGWYDAKMQGLTIERFLYYGGSAYDNFSNIGELFKYIKLNSATMVLSGFSSDEVSVNMKDFIDWDNIDKTTNLFYSQYNSLGFNKYITYEDFLYVWNKILSSSSLTSLGYLFRNCVIISNNAPQPFRLTENNIVNERIKNTYHLFNNCHIAQSINSTRYFPFKINQSFFKCLPKLVNVPYLFANTLWDNPIPFDFFNKREEETFDVFVDNNDSRIQATLYNYKYRSEMEDMSYCFRNLAFSDSSHAFNSDNPCNENKFLKNRVVDDENHEYEEYYMNYEDTTSIKVVQNTEIVEALNAERVNATEWVSVVNPVNGGYQFTNFNVAFNTSTNTSGCFVTPDIFYGMKPSGTNRSIEYSLGIATSSTSGSAFGMSGLIPPNLLKNVKTLSPRGIFTNLNILPWYINSIVKEENNVEVEYKYFCYVPSNFTNYTNLDYVFNFHLILPYTSVSSRSYYFVLHSDSIPSNVTSLASGLPGSTSDNLRDSLLGVDAGSPNTVANNTCINYNVMLEENYELDETFSPIEGFDMSKFTQLKLDNLVNIPLSAFLSGYLIKDGTLNSWSSKKYLSNTGSYVVNIGYTDSWDNGLSRMAKLPLTVNNDRFINTNITNGKIVICKGSVVGGYTADYQTSGNYQNIRFID